MIEIVSILGSTTVKWQKIRKSEALVGAFINTGVFLFSFQFLPAVNAGVGTSDMSIYPRGTYHHSAAA